MSIVDLLICRCITLFKFLTCHSTEGIVEFSQFQAKIFLDKVAHEKISALSVCKSQLEGQWITTKHGSAILTKKPETLHSTFHIGVCCVRNSLPSIGLI